MRNIILGILSLFLMNLCACDSMQSPTGLIPVLRDGEQLYGYINLKGENKIPPKFAMATPFRDGLALVKENEGYGYINEKGNYIVSPKYKDATLFNEDVAWVVSSGEAPILIDNKGKEFFTFKDADAVSVFSDGLALFESDNNKGYIDKTGKIVISEDFEALSLFRSGLAAVKKNEKWGFIDKKGKIIINYQFDDVLWFSKDGLAIVKIGNRWGVINKNGQYIINPVYSTILDDRDGFIVESENALYGYVDRKGATIINPQFGYMQGFNDSNVAPVSIGKKWGFIDKTGKIVLSPQYEYIGEVAKGIAPFIVGDKYGFLDKKGNIVINPQYERVLFAYIQDYDNIAYFRDNTSVYSDYYNMDFIKDKLMPLMGDISEKYIHKPVDNILKRFSKKSSDVNVYSTVNLISESNLTSDIVMKVDLGEPPYTEVSDGWWGTTREFNSAYTLYRLMITLDCKGRAYGKADAIADLFNKVLDTDSLIQKNSKDVFINASAKDSHTVFISVETNHLD